MKSSKINEISSTYSLLFFPSQFSIMLAFTAHWAINSKEMTFCIKNTYWKQDANIGDQYVGDKVLDVVEANLIQVEEAAELDVEKYGGVTPGKRLQ